MKNRLKMLLHLLRDWWRVPKYRAPVWTEFDQAALTAFLQSTTGLRMCQLLDNRVQELAWAAANDGRPHSAGVALGFRLSHNFLGIIANKEQPPAIPGISAPDQKPNPSQPPAGGDGLEHLHP